MDFVELSSVNGFFALRSGAAEELPGSGGHVPLSRVYAGDTAPLAFRIDKVAARLRAPERRVAASIAHLGIVARLWSVALGSAALYDAVPDLAAEGLHWDPDGSTPDDLLLAAPVRELPATAETLRTTLVDGHLLPLAEAFRRDGNISPQLLWGNAGSALAAAVSQLRLWARDTERPEVGKRAAVIAHELFALPDLNSTGALKAGSFRRNSCCLYYRCPAGGLCGDCVFDSAPQRSSARTGSE
ncbi:IucA/IucC family C-terminal-domain containing protein [Streptomyces sp. NPDC021093]|uniref:IucA/IucC family C-terminal-domain containing protein n=1 Tax=Streptomyces sp. NPDC021093 TaxID=3365112 RepID=UPI0037A5D111